MSDKLKVSPRPVTARSKQLYINLRDLMNNKSEFDPYLIACMLDDIPVDCVAAVRVEDFDGKTDRAVYPVAILINDDLIKQLSDGKGRSTQCTITPEEKQQILEKLEEKPLHEVQANIDQAEMIMRDVVSWLQSANFGNEREIVAGALNVFKAQQGSKMKGF